MTKQFKVGIFIGSLRKQSYSRKLGKAFIGLAPKNLSLEFIEIGDLPLYNEDLETDTPPLAWQNFRNALKKVDAVLFITPEYNRSIPAVLKNAIDVGSFPKVHWAALVAINRFGRHWCLMTFLRCSSLKPILARFRKS